MTRRRSRRAPLRPTRTRRPRRTPRRVGFTTCLCGPARRRGGATPRMLVVAVVVVVVILIMTMKMIQTDQRMIGRMQTATKKNKNGPSGTAIGYDLA